MRAFKSLCLIYEQLSRNHFAELTSIYTEREVDVKRIFRRELHGTRG